MILRSWMFVPGDSEKKLGKGASIGADTLIIDLEGTIVSKVQTVSKSMLQVLSEDDRLQYILVNSSKLTGSPVDCGRSSNQDSCCNDNTCRCNFELYKLRPFSL